MRIINQDIDKTIAKVKEMTGQPMTLRVNKGRNKIEMMDGTIENTYPSIFTVRKTDGKLSSFSYSDILSGNITFKHNVLV